MINHEKSKGIGIKPERVRELITEIEQQAMNISKLKEDKCQTKK